MKEGLWLKGCNLRNGSFVQYWGSLGVRVENSEDLPSQPTPPMHTFYTRSFGHVSLRIRLRLLTAYLAT